MNKEQIRVPVKGGYIIAERNPDPDYDGITIYFETSDEDIMDIVLIESKAEDEYDETNVFCFKDVFDEDWKDKFTIKHDDIYEALYKEVE